VASVNENDLTRKLRERVTALEVVVKLAENALINMIELREREQRKTHVSAYLREKQKLTS
jgi:hypothetical protein